METSRLRICVMDVLRGMPANGVNQWQSLVNAVPGSARKHSFISGPAPTGGIRYQNELSDVDQERIREVFWALIIEGVIMPGWDNANPNLPFFNVTEYGRIAINSEEPTPHDPDGFLARLQESAPRLDEVALRYVSEGLKCFQRGTYTAGVIMLGVAAERLTLALSDATAHALPKPEGDRLRDHIGRDKIAKVYIETKKRLAPRASQLPKELSEDMETFLDGAFAVIRTHRNDSGHPTGRFVDRTTAFGLFSTFPFYARKASALIDYLAEHKLT